MSDQDPVLSELDTFIRSRNVHYLKKLRADAAFAAKLDAAKRERAERCTALLDDCQAIFDWRTREVLEGPFGARLWEAFGPEARIPIYRDSFWCGLPVKADVSLACTVVTLDGPAHGFRIEEYFKQGLTMASKSMTKVGELYDHAHPELIRRLRAHLEAGRAWDLMRIELAKAQGRYAIPA